MFLQGPNDRLPLHRNQDIHNINPAPRRKPIRRFCNSTYLPPKYQQDVPTTSILKEECDPKKPKKLPSICKQTASGEVIFQNGFNAVPECDIKAAKALQKAKQKPPIKRPRPAPPPPKANKNLLQLGPCDNTNGCKGPSVIIGYPCGHSFCDNCAGLNMSKEEKDQNHALILKNCPKCYQNFKNFVGFPNVHFVYRAYMDPALDSYYKVKRSDLKDENGQKLVEMRKQFEELKLQFDCQICFDAQCDTTFQCGHRACAQCAEKLTRCHYCRQKVNQRIKIFR